MIREDPYTRQQRHRFSSLSLMAGLWMLLAIIQLVSPHNDLPSIIVFLIPECLGLILVGVIVVRGQARLKHLAQLRESVLRGDSALLAEEQPMPDTNALPMLATIEFNQFRSPRVFFIIGIAIALLIIFVFVIVSPASGSNKHPSNSTFSFIFLAIFIAVMLLILVALVLIFRQKSNRLIYRIAVNEYGITSTYQGITSSMRWSDARLFTITSPDKPTILDSYELANATTVVHWVNLSSQPLFGWGMNATSVEYRNKVQALLSVIAARTGLPLYDFNATLKTQKE